MEKVLSSHNSSIPFKKLIFRNFLTSSLIPLFTIEAVLVLLYFGINAYISRQNVRLLLEGARADVQFIAEKQAEIITHELKEVSGTAQLLQQVHQQFFKEEESRQPVKSTEFAFSPSGVYYKVSDNGGCSLFYSNLATITEKEQKKALQTEAFDPLLKFAVEHNLNIVQAYFNSFDSMCRIYPFMDVIDQFEPNMDIPKYNFYYLADFAHNPGRKSAWTGVYLDPAGKGWMASCIVPVYNGHFLEGVTGLDVTVDRFVDNLLNLQLQWGASAFLADNEGMILAMPSKAEKLLGLTELKHHVYQGAVTQDTVKPEEYNLTKNKDRLVAAGFEGALRGNKALFEIDRMPDEFMVAQSRIPETGWRLFILVDKKILFATITYLKALSKKVGYGAIGIMVFFYILFFGYLLQKSFKLSQRIALPIVKLVERTSDYKNIKGIASCQMVGIQEVDTLTSNFSVMAEELGRYTSELQMTNEELEQHRKNLEKLVEERTADLTAAQARLLEISRRAGMAEVATNVLHNVGNVLTSVNVAANLIRENIGHSKISGLTRVMRLLEEHPHDLGLFLSENPQGRKLMEYVTHLLPELQREQQDSREKAELLVRNIEHIKEIIEVEQGYSRIGGVVETRHPADIVEEAIKINAAGLERHGITLVRDFEEVPPVTIESQKLLQILVNLIGNAKYALDDSPVNTKTLTLRIRKANSQRLQIMVEDNGVGIPEENLIKIFSHGFSTRRNGHGFGLHASANATKELGGTLHAVSEGTGKGAVFTVEIPLVRERSNHTPYETHPGH